MIAFNRVDPPETVAVVYQETTYSVRMPRTSRVRAFLCGLVYGVAVGIVLERISAGWWR